jgi:hypothetical protein
MNREDDHCSASRNAGSTSTHYMAKLWNPKLHISLVLKDCRLGGNTVGLGHIWQLYFYFYYGNCGALSSVSDVGHYVIINYNVTTSYFNVFPVFIRQLEIQIYLHRTTLPQVSVHKVTWVLYPGSYNSWTLPKVMLLWIRKSPADVFTGISRTPEIRYFILRLSASAFS